MRKLSHKILVGLLVLVLNSSPAFAQEEDERATKKPKQSAKEKTAQDRKADDRFYSFKTDTRIGYSSNVFKTPTGEYVDPESGLLRTSSPTASYFINPDFELALLPYNKKRFQLEIAYSWDGIFFPAGGTVKNADGYAQRLQAQFDFDFVNNLPNDKENFVVRKSSMDLRIYRKQVKYNYLHRGTGELRNTRVASIDEENRYQHWENGAVIEFKTRFTSGTKIALSAASKDRDYEDITSLQSYDRKELETKIEAEQEFGTGWNAFVDWSTAKLQYDRHRASNTAGTSVPGTTRTFNDTEVAGGLEYKHDSIQTRLKYSNFKRDDIYAGYWSYDRNKLSLLLAKEWPSFGRLKIEGTQENRQYKLETNSFGAIRSRKANELELGWDREFTWGTLSALVSQLNQEDTDSYYSHKNTTAQIGFEKDF